MVRKSRYIGMMRGVIVTEDYAPVRLLIVIAVAQPRKFTADNVDGLTDLQKGIIGKPQTDA